MNSENVRYERGLNEYLAKKAEKAEKEKEQSKKVVVIKEKVRIVKVIKIKALNEFNISRSEQVVLERCLCKEIKSLTRSLANVVSVSKEHPMYSTYNYYIEDRKMLLKIYNRLKGNVNEDRPIYPHTNNKILK